MITLQNKKPEAFFQYGNDATDVGYEYEEALVANTAGLEHLKLKIDEALAGSEEVAFSDVDVSTDFTCIRLANRVLETKPSDTNSDRIALFGCALSILALGSIFVCGIIKIIEMIR